MPQLIHDIVSPAAHDYRRFIHLLRFLLIQADAIKGQVGHLPVSRIRKMTDYHKRLEFIMRDLLTDPMLGEGRSEEVRCQLDMDECWEIMNGLDSLIDEAMHQHNEKLLAPAA